MPLENNRFEQDKHDRRKSVMEVLGVGAKSIGNGIGQDEPGTGPRLVDDTAPVNPFPAVPAGSSTVPSSPLSSTGKPGTPVGHKANTVSSIHSPVSPGPISTPATSNKRSASSRSVSRSIVLPAHSRSASFSTSISERLLPAMNDQDNRPYAIYSHPQRHPSTGKQSQSSSSSRRPTNQYMAQEQAYIEKLRSSNLVDDYYTKGLSTFESDSDNESSGSVDSDNERDQKLSDHHSYWEAALPLNNPENSKERREWQEMLSVVLTGEVVQSEKKRLGNPKKTNFMLEDDLWMALRAKICGRTLTEQKRIIEYSRTNVHETLDAIMKFSLSANVTLTQASDKVDAILGRLDNCESLWRSMQAMKADNELYASNACQKRIDALRSWRLNHDNISRELNLLKAWTGNENLDPTVKPDQNIPVDSMVEEITLLDRILKTDDLPHLFEYNVRRSLGPVIEKARSAVLDLHDLYLELGLPFFLDSLLSMIQFPVKLIREIIRIRLTYARGMVNPTMMIVDQLIEDLRLFLEIARDVKSRNIEYTRPYVDKGWVFPNYSDKDLDSTVIDCIQYYGHLLHSKFLESSKSNKTFRTFKETEQLEVHYIFLYDIGRYFQGSDVPIAEQFSALTGKLLSRLPAYWEDQLRGPSVMNEVEIRRWYTATIENVRSSQRKLLRFHR